MNTTPTKYRLPQFKTRILLEREVIGRAITDIPSALTLSDVLTQTNFKEPLCEKLYPIILEGVESADFGLLYVTKQYYERYKELKAYEITALTLICREESTTLELALLILESDIREKFLELIVRKENEAVKASDFESAAAWKQSADHLTDMSNDIFEAVDQLHAYLKVCFPDQMEEYETLRSAIPKLIDRIKKRKNTRKFLNTLTRLAGVSLDSQSERTVNILKDWIVLCMGGFKLPEKFHETIHQLNHTWHE
jgi:hypothetical protein